MVAMFALISRYLTQSLTPLAAGGMRPRVSGERPRGRHIWGAKALPTNSNSFRLTPCHPGICAKWPILRENGLSPAIPRELPTSPEAHARSHFGRVSQTLRRGSAFG